MKTEQSIQELKAKRDRLHKSLNLFDLAASEEAPDFLRHMDIVYARDLFGGGSDLPWAEEGLFPESARFMAGLRRATAGQRLALEFEVEILEKLKSTKVDQAHRGPFGLFEMAFPVRLRDMVVHVVWSGKVREEPFSQEEIQELAHICQISAPEAAGMAAMVPVLERRELDRALAWASRLRTALERALGQHLHALDLTQQLVQSERTQSLGTLSSGVAHHFNNLLSVILGYSSFVLNRESLSREAAEALHKITDSAQRGRRLTEEILAFQGSDVEEEAPCPLHETLTSVLSLLEAKTAANILVATRLEARHDTVLAPPSSIRQIIFNLLTNAFDSMPSGGTLTVATSNTEMQTDAGKQEFIRLDITDNNRSSGAAPVSSESKVSLKLSSVYGMVGRLDGTVLVSSEPGAAGSVQILLPAAVSDESVLEEKKVRRRLAPSEIWVVDDDAIFREMCRQVLSDEGHTVAEMSGGREFQERWKKGESRPDLILMDFSMPEYNGLQLCEWLRGEGARVPVILVSGFSSNQPDIRKALRLKKIFFLQKPFSFREMADTVTVALGETLIGE